MPWAIDNVDIHIIEALLADGRATNRALAKRVGLSESACGARVKQLKELGIIAGYSAKIALDRLGIFRTWADVVLVDDRPSTIGRFEDLLLREPEILSADVRLPLAILAVAAMHEHGWAGEPVTHGAAKAAAFQVFHGAFPNV